MKFTKTKVVKKLRQIMKEQPRLTDYGMGVYDSKRLTPKEYKKKLAQERKDLRESIDDITWTVNWLETNIMPIKTLNRRHSSYGLKHIAEKQSPKKYITNGVFIAAALIVGYKGKLNHTNPYFAMSERSIKQAIRKNRAKR